MLTAAIASSDIEATGQMLASLQQTGLVSSVKSWTIPGDKIDGSEPIPDIVLLDLGRDPEISFAFGSNLRRLRPAVRLIDLQNKRSGRSVIGQVDNQVVARVHVQRGIFKAVRRHKAK